jgi:prolyl oligopeptidase
MRTTLLLTVALCALGVTMTVTADDDPFLWLEEVEGAEALSWVEAQNAASFERLSQVPEYQPTFDTLMEIYDSKDNIPGIGFMGPFVYNFWQDADHVRGIWRRTSLESYATDAPTWETVIDVDALAEAEGENWVWKGASCLWPEHRHCMVSLSRGGADATVKREFDTFAKRFVEDGFTLDEAKSTVSWMDENTLWVATDFGEGSLTSSGYPRITKLWQRGAPLDHAETVFEGRPDDVFTVGTSLHSPEGRTDMVVRIPEFFKSDTYLRLGKRLVHVDIPVDASFGGLFQDHMMVTLRTDWTPGDITYRGGSLLIIGVDDFLQGSRDFDVLFEPSERISLGSTSATQHRILVSTLDNVRGKLWEMKPDGEGGWAKRELALPGLGTIGLGSVADFEDRFLFTYTDFLTPSSLYLVDGDADPVQLKTTPEWFDAEGMAVAQHEAISSDGTAIPYFVVTPKGFTVDGSAPTILYGYGGFKVPQLASYSGTIGNAWLERGGVWVLANIRGGGEFGPAWHQAALRENRQLSFDDFIAVAEDLIERKITSPDHLGIMGGSNGGLLVGAVFAQRPELFDAVVCQVPLLDMKRYSKLLAGASWMAEYGDPDTEDWEFMQHWSPYHLVTEDGDYPEVFFYTSTRDDRVHPGHARKMVAKMADQGHPVLYFENTEGGHAAGATNEQRAKMWALTYAYLWEQLR